MLISFASGNYCYRPFGFSRECTCMHIYASNVTKCHGISISTISKAKKKKKKKKKRNRHEFKMPQYSFLAETKEPVRLVYYLIFVRDRLLVFC